MKKKYEIRLSQSAFKDLKKLESKFCLNKSNCY